MAPQTAALEISSLVDQLTGTLAALDRRLRMKSLPSLGNLVRKLIAMLALAATAGLSSVTSARAEYADVSDGGTLANAASTPISVSGDGRYVLFTSTATNLVAGPPSGTQGYLRDRLAATTTLPVADYLPVAMTPDARYLLVSKNGLFVYDRQTPGWSGSTSPRQACRRAPRARRPRVRSVRTAATSSSPRPRPTLSRGHQRGAGRVPPRPSARHDRAGERPVGLGRQHGRRDQLRWIGRLVHLGGRNLVAGDENHDEDIFARPLGGPSSSSASTRSGSRMPPRHRPNAPRRRPATMGALSPSAAARRTSRARACATISARDHAYIRDRLAGTTARADVDASGPCCPRRTAAQPDDQRGRPARGVLGERDISGADRVVGRGPERPGARARGPRPDTAAQP